MSNEIKQIAALIGYQQMQENGLAALIGEFQKESAQLSWQRTQLTQVISGEYIILSTEVISTLLPCSEWQRFSYHLGLYY